MWQNRGSRREQRRDWTEPMMHIRQLEDDADVNDATHQQLREDMTNAVQELKKVTTEEMKEFRTKLDRVQWALATAAISFSLMAGAFVFTR